MGLLEKLVVPQWHIGVIPRPVSDLLDGYRDSEINWLHIRPEPECAADPFGLVRDGRLHVFFEFKPFGPRSGFIAHVEVGSDNTSTPALPVLTLSHHLSYPFLFEFGGDLLMVPESAQAREVMLFRCAQFPDRWEKVATILPEIEAVDSSVIYHDGLWWLFSACGRERDELHVWYTANPLGPWKAHPLNPVVTGLGSTRPAGTPFEAGGRVFRPAQDNSKSYGRRIVLNRVTVLSTDQFCEQPVAHVEPDSASYCPAGRHTLSAVGSITLIDGLRRAKSVSPRKLMGKLRDKLSAISSPRQRDGG